MSFKLSFKWHWECSWQYDWAIGSLRHIKCARNWLKHSFNCHIFSRFFCFYEFWALEPSSCTIFQWLLGRILILDQQWSLCKSQRGQSSNVLTMNYCLFGHQDASTYNSHIRTRTKVLKGWNSSDVRWIMKPHIRWIGCHDSLFASCYDFLPLFIGRIHTSRIVGYCLGCRCLFFGLSKHFWLSTSSG